MPLRKLNHNNKDWQGLLNGINQITPENLSSLKKRNYVEVLQHVVSNNDHTYGRRCIGTYHLVHSKKPYYKMGQYWLKQHHHIADHISMRNSCYASVNSFKRGGSLMKNKHTGEWYYGFHHSKDLVTGLFGNYVDLDAKKIGLEYGAQIEPYYHKILQLSQLPTPSFVINSGHGLHLLWLYKSEVVVNNPVMMDMWQKVEDFFIDKIKEASIKYISKHYQHSYMLNTYETRHGHFSLVDEKVSDPSRYLRIPGSYNWKDRKNPLLVKTLEDNHVSYNFCGHYSGLYYNFISRFAHNWVNYKHSTEKTTADENRALNVKNEKVSSPRSNSADVDLKDGYMSRAINSLGKTAYLLKDRISDYHKLIAMRNHWEDSGYRNELVFQYCVALHGLGYPAKVVYKDALKFNHEFNQPLSNTEVAGCARYGSHRNYTQLSKYKYSNSYIMSGIHLNISSKEQKHMSTLIGSQERKRRQRIAKAKSHKRVTRWRIRHGLAGKMTIAKWNRAKKQSKAKRMVEHTSLPKVKIAKKLNISYKTMKRWTKGIHHLSK